MRKTYAGIVGEKFNVRSSFDHRYRVDSYTLSYRGDDGYEYRKGIEVAPGTDIVTVLERIPRQWPESRKGLHGMTVRDMVEGE